MDLAHDSDVSQRTRDIIEQRFGPANPQRLLASPARFLKPRSRIDENAPDAETVRERAIVRFVTCQFFFEIYLEKFGLPPGDSTKVTLPLVLMMISVAYMLLQRKITISPLRFGLFLVFVFFMLLSQIQVVRPTSPTSIGQIFVIYSFMTLSAPLSEEAYFKVLRRFILMMIVPAFIGDLQYVIQLFNGGGDPIGMDKVVPQTFLMQGYWYDAHYPRWNDPFQRPNGFFFLEPSFFSYFLAAAAIIEATYFRRPLMFGFFVVTTMLSTGGTGMSMLLVVFPVLLLRESPRIVLAFVILAVIGVIVALALGINLPLISRLSEFDQGGIGGQGGSGGNRMVVPFNLLIETLSDPSFITGGMGAGSTTGDMGSAWPVLKLTYEYGLLSMISFMVFFLIGVFSSNYNMPLAIAAMFVFHVTGAYLHDDIANVFFIIILTIVAPPRKKADTSFFTDNMEKMSLRFERIR